MKSKTILILLLVMTVTGCDYLRNRHQVGAVAEIGQQYLTEEEIYNITIGLSPEDSARVAEQYIRQWAIRILEYEKAMGSKNEKVETMVEDYRRSLYMHEYEQRLVSKKMNKYIEDSVIQQFYDTHKEDFILKDNIVKGALIVVPIQAPKTDKLRKYLSNLKDDENLEKIEKYAYQYSSGYELFTDQWKTASQILVRLPLEKDILQEQLRKTTLIEVADSTNLYLLQVTEKKMKGDYMPLEFAKDEIRKYVLSQRQVEFLHKEREKLYDEAIRHNKLIRLDKNETKE